LKQLEKAATKDNLETVMTYVDNTHATKKDTSAIFMKLETKAEVLEVEELKNQAQHLN